MYKLPTSLQQKLAKRIQDNSFRTVQPQQHLIDFYSNDYLGFAQSLEIKKQVDIFTKEQGCSNGSTGSRLISGTHAIHLEVEQLVAAYHGATTGLLYNSGYDANVGLFSSILQKNEVLLYDELIHASVRDGIRLSNAHTYKFKHNNKADLEQKLQRFKETATEIYVAIETVYSMDGDTAPVKDIAELCSKYRAHLIVDEAHSGGVFGNAGKGCVSELGIETQVFARIHTFGKALGCHGAIVLGSEQLRDYLINFSRSFIYTTALPVHEVATIKAAYLELKKGIAIDQLQSKITYFQQQLEDLQMVNKFIPSNSAIHCCIVSGNEAVKHLAQKIQKKGINIKPILSPTVPKGKERLRICLHAFNTLDEIKLLTELIAKNIKA